MKDLKFNFVILNFFIEICAMITPKILGSFLILIFIMLLLIYMVTNIKLILFYSLMFLLFGAACFKHIYANVNILKGKTIFLYKMPPDISHDLCKTLLNIGVKVVLGINETEIPLFDVKNENLKIVKLSEDIKKTESAIKCIVKELSEQDIKVHAVVTMHPDHHFEFDFGKPEKMNIDLLQMYMNEHLLSKMMITRLFLPIIKGSQGRFLFINSYLGRVSIPNQTNKCVVEHGLESFCDCLRRELISDDVPVSLVEIPNVPMKNMKIFMKTVMESLASSCPKDRYLLGEGQYFLDTKKMMLMIHQFLPASLVDTIIHYNS